MKKELREKLIEKNFLFEKETHGNFFKIGHMEDFIHVIDTLEEAEKDWLFVDFTKEHFENDMVKESQVFKEYYSKIIKHVKEIFEQKRKIIYYEEWGKVINTHYIRDIIWQLLQKYPDYVLVISYSDSGIIRVEDTHYSYSSRYGSEDFDIEEVLEFDEHEFTMGTKVN